MSEERKAAIQRALDEALNQGNLAALDEVYAQDYILHQAPFPDIEGLNAYKTAMAGARRGLPDLHITVQEVIGDRDTTAVRWTYQGTHANDWLGIAATGKQITVAGCTVSHWKNGKVVEEWYYGDVLGLMQQLGAVG